MAARKMKTHNLILINFLLILGSLVDGRRVHPRATASDSLHGLTNDAERTPEYWNWLAQSALAEKIELTQKNQADELPKAKNVILFLGDGMSVHTVTASRNLLGDSANPVSFDKFPFVGLSKTYCVNRQVADSACTATAYLGGVKGNYGTIGVNAKVPRYDCLAGQNPENFVYGMAKWAQDAGKDTGLVSTARVTHASPAGVYAHTPNRNWENDAEIISDGCSPVDNVDIARQLVEWEVGRKLKVILGGGRQNFINETVNDEEGQQGARTDGLNLIHDWLADKKASNARAEYVWSKKGLNSIDMEKTEYLLGLFSSSHCPYHGDLERDHLQKGDPSLTEMTLAAIKMLQKNENGYFLFVEGARIDMAHHDTMARKSLEDTLEFANAIEKARAMTSENDTLIVVTADHSHTMTINGYPYRDQDIFGLSDKLADDGKPFTILSYANGPGFYNSYSYEQGRNEISSKFTNVPNYEYLASVPLDAETHGGEDVAVYASGPFAQYFSGNYEQTNIPALMARAVNIGPFANL